MKGFRADSMWPQLRWWRGSALASPLPSFGLFLSYQARSARMLKLFPLVRWSGEGRFYINSCSRSTTRLKTSLASLCGRPRDGIVVGCPESSGSLECVEATSKSSSASIFSVRSLARAFRMHNGAQATLTRRFSGVGSISRLCRPFLGSSEKGHSVNLWTGLLRTLQPRHSPWADFRQ